MFIDEVRFMSSRAMVAQEVSVFGEKNTFPKGGRMGVMAAGEAVFF
jgi:hypothetical protein